MNKDALIDYGERIFLVLLIAPFLYRFAIYLPTHPFAIALVISESLAVVLIVVRKSGPMVLSPYSFFISLTATALPLLAFPGDRTILPEALTFALMIAGLAINIFAKLALNRSFGLVAANRGIKRSGPYRIVRHPMYLGYFVTQVGFLLSAFSLPLLMLYIVVWSMQVLRILDEERFLMMDSDYREFARNVPRRILPGF